jgi:hypothetical protein
MPLWQSPDMTRMLATSGGAPYGAFQSIYIAGVTASLQLADGAMLPAIEDF